MFYVILLLIIAVASILLGGPFQTLVRFEFPPNSDQMYQTSLWLLVACSALGGAVVTWLAGWRQASSAGRRVTKLEGMVRKAKELLAERDGTISQYEEQLVALGALEPKDTEEEVETPAEDAEPPEEEQASAEAEAAEPEEETP